MIRLETMPFRRFTAKLTSSANASGCGQVSGLSTHTPFQPVSGRKKPDPRIDPAREAKILTRLSNVNRSLRADVSQPAHAREIGLG